jgi:hypothetical protein
MPLLKWLVPATTGVAGFVAGFLINGRSEEPRPHSPESAAVVVYPGGTATPAAVPSTAPVTLDDLRRVVREELAALPAGAATRATAGSGLENSTANSVVEQNSAATQARAVLDAALSRRSWTEADREALHAQFLAMSPAQRDEWLLQYSQAVNQGRLVPDSERPPF